LIGKRRLEKAISRVDPEKTEFEIHYVPYHVDPSITEPRPVKEYLSGRLGPDFESKLAGAREAASEFGYTFPFNGFAANTFDAHRVITYTGNKLGWKAQQKVLDATFEAYFEEGKDVSNPAVLVECAATAGVPEAQVLALLSSDDLKAEVQRQMDARRKIGSIPGYSIDGKISFTGTQGPETFTDIFEDLGIPLLDA
jgi:predicted DsbA family dithiol-disulfide isomerase